MHRKRKLPLLLLALLVAGGTAFAFVPVPDGNRLEVARPGWEDEGLWIEAGFDNAMSKVSPLSALAERYGGEWRYDRNRVTGSLHHVYGSGVDFAGAIHADADAERAARDFVAENARLFGAATEDLRVSRVQTAPGKYAVHFDQFVDGVRVFGGNAHVVLTDAGRIFAFGSDAYPRVKELLPGTTPALSEAEALAEAKNEIDFLDGRDEITYQELVILPTREGAGEELALTYHLAYRFDLFTWDPRGHWETYVDAHTGEILWRRSLIFPLDFTGHARGDVEWEGYCDGYTYDFPMEQMQLTISGVGIATTDIDGDFTLSYGGTDSKSITARFQSAFLHTHRYTGTDAVLTGTITPGTPYTIDWSNSNSLDSERDTYAFLNREHRWLKALDPTFTGLDYAMPDTVERTDGYCPGNAWYDYYGVNFCVGSIDYANTGRMGDVAYHEYGHGITHELYNPYDPPSSVHEGNSDIASLFLTREPRLGLGFYLDNCTSGIRNADNSLIYPDDLTGSGHTDGQMLSGFIYDSWQALLGAYSQTYADSVVEYAWWFGRKLGLPQSMPDQVYWTFVGDDDDGNLDNGTPHHAMFCVGATNHGFDCPEILSPVAIAHTPITEHTTAADPIPVTATITSGAGDIEESALRVYYKVDGGSLLNVGMAGGGGDVYTGTIPAQSAGAFVQYYLYAEDEYANSAVSPSNAPVDLYGFYVGEFTLVFEDDFETDKGWTVGDAGDDATTGIWERGDPQGTNNGVQVQPEDDHTDAPGVNCYATGLLAGTGVGSYDIDGGKTTVLSPVFDLDGATMAIASYWRWYSNNAGASPGEDYWEVQVNDGSGWEYLEYTTATDNSWTRFLFNLGDYVDLTSTVQLRFIASDEINGSLVEAALDDFLLRAIFPTGVDSVLSTVEANDHVMLAPDGSGDSTLTITVTVRDGSGDPMPDIPAGDVAVHLSGVSSLGQSIHFCASGTDELDLISTVATDGSGQLAFTVVNAGGCGTITIDATVQGTLLANSATVHMRSPDFTGDGEVNYNDTFQYLPFLNAATGYCGNLSGDADEDVDFYDTFKYLPALSSGATCP